MRIKAYTIVEIVVSMLIASILLTLSWNVVLMVRNFKNQIETKAEGLNKVARIEYLLKMDFREAISYKVEAGVFDIYRSLDTVTYLTDSAVVRVKNGMYDTLLLGSSVILEDRLAQGVNVCIRLADDASCYRLRQITAGEKRFKEAYQ